MEWPSLRTAIIGIAAAGGLLSVAAMHRAQGLRIGT
jgi:hypothetical protein